MGPAILARADVAPFAAKIHGSALEYTVKPHPRFLPYADEGMEAANGVLVGSAPHRRVALGGPARTSRTSRHKTRLGPPGRRRLERRSARCEAPERDAIPPGRLRRQADRLQGGRPAARGLAAGPAPRTRRPGSRSPASASTRTGCGGCWPPSSAATSTTPARSPRLGRGPRGRGGGAAADPLGLPRRPARRATSRPPAAPPARSSSSAGSSTTRSPRCCRGPRRW